MSESSVYYDANGKNVIEEYSNINKLKIWRIILISIIHFINFKTIHFKDSGMNVRTYVHNYCNIYFLTHQC